LSIWLSLLAVEVGFWMVAAGVRVDLEPEPVCLSRLELITR
jgi:hypothetical protein